MQPILSRLAGWLVMPGAIFLLAVPAIIMQLISDTQNHILFGEHWGGWSMLTHRAFFLTGYFCPVFASLVLETYCAIIETLAPLTARSFPSECFLS